ncbi:DUF4153 domain-containing protein [Ruminococcus sp.]|uniref:DUF4153 domain-containing protein n=1 Tax=Ruminococcus sp. TaxID=41978 RepID=UPI0025D09C56|nr:DUF4173 domain-containing protein [Ruminococcus sp.]
MNDNTLSMDSEQFCSKTKPEYTKADRVLSVVVMAAAFGFVRYVLFHATGFITTGLFIAFITAAILYLRNRKCEFSGFNKLLTVILYVFSIVFSITANNFIKVLDAMFLFIAGAYMIYSVGAGNKNIDRFLPFAMIKSLLEYPFAGFGAQGSIASDTMSDSKTGKNIKLIIIGLIITLPLTAIVAALLMSADKGVENMLSRLFEGLDSGEFWNIVIELIFALPFSMYIFGMFYTSTHCDEERRLDERKCIQRIYSMRFISNLICYTAVTPICVLYVMFFISQTRYFLSAFMGSLPDGFTYADYARRGFFELFAVALINLGVLCFISLHSKKAGREKPFTLKLYSIVLSVFTLILIATAISKMVMYISRYGLTELRVYTSWFMVLLAAVFVLIIVKQFRFDMKFSKHLAVIFTVMFAALCFSRPEALIAKYNIEMYESGYLKELDTEALLDMSDDARLVALESGVVTEEEISWCKYSGYEGHSYGRYNISSVMLDSKT